VRQSNKLTSSLKSCNSDLNAGIIIHSFIQLSQNLSLVFQFHVILNLTFPGTFIYSHKCQINIIISVFNSFLFHT
jgi:hypothetical protein